jgi:hypothetical protein
MRNPTARSAGVVRRRTRRATATAPTPSKQAGAATWRGAAHPVSFAQSGRHSSCGDPNLQSASMPPLLPERSRQIKTKRAAGHEADSGFGGSV